MKKKNIMLFLLSILLVGCSNVNRKKDNITINNIDSKESKKDNEVHIFEWINNDTNTLENINKLSEVVNKGDYSNIDNIPDSHAKNVTFVYLENNGINGKEYKLSKKVKKDVKDHVKLYPFTYSNIEVDKLSKTKGIINLSFGNVDFPKSLFDIHEDTLYINSTTDSNFDKLENRTEWSRLLDPNIYHYEKYNTQLKIKALGNEGETYWSGPSSTILYSRMSPEIQKMARNDIILAANIVTPEVDSPRYKECKIYKVNGVDYYLPDLNNSKALLLRSFTLATPGFRSVSLGSSYSAPIIARTAQMILKKYPYLTYNQVKQILLTTAKSNKDYLNDYIGCGILDAEKALKGPGALNGGLIEEEKYWKGNYDKVVDKRDKNLFYMYVDIPENEESIWSNDIEGGLKGDGTTKEYDTKDVVVDNTNNIKHKFRIPKVLESERNYYENVAKGGLRKAGKGTLYLTGKQLYNSNTQILDGKLVLQNDSNSKYEIFNKSSFEISGANVNINNDVYNDESEFNVKTKLKLNNYQASKDSRTIIEADVVANNNFYIDEGGEIDFVVKKSKNKPRINAKNENIKKIKLGNVFAKIVEVKPTIDKNKEYTIKEDIPGNDNKKLSSLSKKEKEDLAYYDPEINDFFEEYRSEREEKEKNSFINVVASSRSEAIKDIFTKDYSSFMAENIDILNDISDNNKLSYELNDGRSIYLNQVNTFGVFRTNNYNRFSRLISGLSIGSKINLGKDINIGLDVHGYEGNYLFNHKNKIINTTYGTNFRVGGKVYKGLGLELGLGYNFGINKMLRYMNKDRVLISSNFKTSNIRLDGEVKYDVDILNNLSITPHFGLKYDYIKLHDTKEKISSDDVKDLALDFKNNNIHMIKPYLGLNVKYKMKNFELINNFNYEYNPLNEMKLKANIINKSINLKGYSTKMHKFSYTISGKYINNGYNINGSLKIGSDRKLTTNLGVGFEF